MGGATLKTRRWVGVGISCLLSTLLASSVARADDADDLAGLLDEHVVSGASKTDELAKDAPATTFVITAEDMRRYGIRSIAEAIDFLGMGLVTQNPLHSVEVGGRGVLLTSDFGNHVLLVVDGHVLNEQWDGTAYFEQGAAIPLELIDHIELVLGPGAVLYGGNAMFGVVNVVTKRAAAFNGLHFIAEGGLSPEQGGGGKLTSFAPADLGGSYRLATGIGHKLTLFGRPAELVAQAELYRQNGPSFDWPMQTVTNDDGTPKSFGPRTPPGQWGGRTTRQYSTSVPSIYARLEAGALSVMVRAASYRRTMPAPGFSLTDSDFDEPRSFERDRFLSADVQYRTQIGQQLRLSLRGYGDVYDYLEHMYSSDPSACSTPTNGPCLFAVKGHSRWMGSEVQGEYDWTGSGRLTTMLGVDGKVREVGGETSSIEADTSRVVDVGGKKSLTEIVWAAYVQQRWTPLTFIHLNAGARYDADPRGGDRTSPRAAAAFDVWRDGVMKVSYAEAFRAPTFYEAFYESPDQRANPSIHSESVRGIDASMEQRFGRHKLMIGAFRTWWNDMLTIRPAADGILQYENVARIDNYGYNARAEGAIGAFRYGGSVTGAYTRRSTPDGRDPLPVAPQLFGNLRASYILPGNWPTVALATTFVGKRPADRAFDGGFTPTPYAPASAELRLTLSQRVPGIPGLSYRVAGSVTTGSVAPYVAGPTQLVAADAPSTAAQLTPVVRLVTFGTLQYDLPL
ncbi:MAG TPA: TonB-dependent receptor [Labilithrix sp.]|nr:TonB-dependent receptor [Labilithrix sp.]